MASYRWTCSLIRRLLKYADSFSRCAQAADVNFAHVLENELFGVDLDEF